MVLHTTNTMNPFRSRSRDRDRVRGNAGDPAMTTTSTRPPLRALLARRVLRPSLLLLYVRYITTPAVRTTTPVRILCRDTQPVTLSYVDAVEARAFGAGGGSLGRMDSGIHVADERVCLRASESFSTPLSI
jgi:hypothetical protein